MGLLSPLEKDSLRFALTLKCLSSYRIARRLHRDPPSVHRALKSALRKLREAQQELTEFEGWEKLVEEATLRAAF
jgi:hypothetical protein